ncbi:unnamed protein product [Parascedosporium putredinis]|uniref:NACHT domain-containing protein n=1 Tax=Parascedosporium putredinis TaxID=1442378 RepID=A0A9P1H426_9PEZI|nr:unnamed protein product [Parascedosporium putredinis]CAI7996349.1 unnamed protein product [Parascedosporium putredinis]
MSGIGEAATIVGLVTGIISILGTIKSIHDGVQDARGLPEAFHDVADRLPSPRIPSDCEAMRPVTEACKEKATRLEKIFEKVAPQPDDSRFERYRSVARVMGKGSRVEALMKGILADLQLLAQSFGVRAVTAEQLDEKLSKAIRELAEAKPSLPEEEVSVSQFHSGSGHNIAGISCKGPRLGAFTLLPSYFMWSVISTDPADRVLRLLHEKPTVPARQRQRKKKPQKTEGTCDWLLGDEKYVEWRKGEAASRILWVSSGPGRGKTMLAISVVDAIERAKTDGEILLYFFYRNGDNECNTVAATWADLACQILDQQAHLAEYILDYFTPSGECRVSVETLFETLLGHVEQDVVCILDGLDECKSSEEDLERFLQQLVDIFSTRTPEQGLSRLQLLIFSRDRPRCIEGVLNAYPRIDLDRDAAENVKADVKRYINAKMEELKRQKVLESDQVEQVKEYLETHAAGTFLWVGYVAFELRYKPWLEVEPILRSIPKDLDGVYKRIIDQVENHLRADVKASQRLAAVLKWIVLSHRYLMLEELAAATRSVHLQDMSPEEMASDVLYVKYILSLCGYLIRIVDVEGGGEEIQLLHQSAKEFLLRGQPSTNTPTGFLFVDAVEGHRSIGDICLAHVEDAYPEALRGSQTSQAQLPLLGYAVANWTEHARHIPLDYGQRPGGDPSTLRVHSGNAGTYERRGGSNFGNWREKRRIRLPTSRDYISPQVRYALKSWVHHTDSSGRTPLLCASERGHVPLVRLLLKKGSAVNAQDGQGRTPLHHAAKRGDEAMLSLLNGSEQAVKALLAENARVAYRYTLPPRLESTKGAAELEAEKQAAADLFLVEGREGIVGRQLVTYVETLSDLSNAGMLELFAVSLDHLLFDGFFYYLYASGKVKSRAEKRLKPRERSPLMRAVENGNLALVRLLLGAKDADLEERCQGGRTLVSWAAGGGHEAVVRLLLELGADVLSRDDQEFSPLPWACQAGHGTVVKLLLERSPTDELHTRSGRTALLSAAAAGHEEVVDILLTAGIDPNVVNEDDRTALIYAAAGARGSGEGVARGRG